MTEINELLPITITIAERKYKVKSQPDEEVNFRRASSLIKEKLDAYAQLYAYKDKQDLLAMVLLEYVTQYIKVEQKRNFKDDEVIHTLEKLDNMLDQQLDYEEKPIM
ncbi:MAG: cell division protein ZapA [Bacteroidales bacterium]|jgi:cell division protein ZapA (FtsZ GTPase activity inhibitor)|nr:cell division protein ZapA [Bacteroidales bacterium]